MSLLTDDEWQANDYNYQEQKPTDTINGVLRHARELGWEYLQRLESNRIFPTSEKETGTEEEAEGWSFASRLEQTGHRSHHFSLFPFWHVFVSFG